jgi:hypothetical protein
VQEAHGGVKSQLAAAQPVSLGVPRARNGELPSGYDVDGKLLGMEATGQVEPGWPRLVDDASNVPAHRSEPMQQPLGFGGLNERRVRAAARAVNRNVVRFLVNINADVNQLVVREPEWPGGQTVSPSQS